MAMPLDVRDVSQMKKVVKEIITTYGKIDAVIHNAGALHWKSIEQTYYNNYDLINSINSRASFLLSQMCLKYMKHDGYGHIIMHSPPLPNSKDTEIYKNKTAYMISKLGMTMTAMGISSEYKGTGVAANTIWPSTPIESFATKNHDLGDEKMWRKPDIISDAILEILKEDPKEFTGNQLIDEGYLRTKGVEDFSKYQCVKGCEPPKLMDVFDKFQ